MQATIESIVAAAPATANTNTSIGFQWFLAAIQRALAVIKPAPDQLDEFIRHAEELFDKYVVPYDIPGVGPIVERWIEQALRAQIRPLILRMFADHQAAQAGVAISPDGTMEIPLAERAADPHAPYPLNGPPGADGL